MKAHPKSGKVGKLAQSKPIFDAYKSSAEPTRMRSEQKREIVEKVGLPCRH
jgi:hypothetical protein